MADDFFRQCFLHKETWRTMTWLPEKLAVVGQAVALKQFGSGWIVAEVFERVEGSKLPTKNHKIAC